MSQAKHGKEIVVTMKNRIGLLFEISKLLSEKGVSIRAVCGTVSGDDCLVRLVTDDNLRTKDTLTEKGYSPREEDVILLELPHKPGLLRRFTEALAQANIDIHHLYATALDEQDRCLLVLHTTGDEHAIPKLSNMILA